MKADILICGLLIFEVSASGALATPSLILKPVQAELQGESPIDVGFQTSDGFIHYNSEGIRALTQRVHDLLDRRYANKTGVARAREAYSSTKKVAVGIPFLSSHEEPYRSVSYDIASLTIRAMVPEALERVGLGFDKLVSFRHLYEPSNIRRLYNLPRTFGPGLRYNSQEYIYSDIGKPRHSDGKIIMIQDSRYGFYELNSETFDRYFQAYSDLYNLPLFSEVRNAFREDVYIAGNYRFLVDGKDFLIDASTGLVLMVATAGIGRLFQPLLGLSSNWAATSSGVVRALKMMPASMLQGIVLAPVGKAVYTENLKTKQAVLREKSDETVQRLGNDARFQSTYPQYIKRLNNLNRFLSGDRFSSLRSFVVRPNILEILLNEQDKFDLNFLSNSLDDEPLEDNPTLLRERVISAWNIGAADKSAERGIIDEGMKSGLFRELLALNYQKVTGVEVKNLPGSSLGLMSDGDDAIKSGSQISVDNDRFRQTKASQAGHVAHELWHYFSLNSVSKNKCYYATEDDYVSAIVSEEYIAYMVDAEVLHEIYGDNMPWAGHLREILDEMNPFNFLQYLKAHSGWEARSFLHMPYLLRSRSLAGGNPYSECE